MTGRCYAMNQFKETVLHELQHVKLAEEKRNGLHKKQKLKVNIEVVANNSIESFWRHLHCLLLALVFLCHKKPNNGQDIRKAQHYSKKQRDGAFGRY